MTDDDPSRRTVLGLLAGVGAGGATDHGAGDLGGGRLAQTTADGGTYDTFYRGETVDDLPDPSSEPAIGLTSDGWYEWPDGNAVHPDGKELPDM